MHMPRNPLCKSYPAAAAIRLLGCDRVAEVVDRLHSTIRDWADPNRPACPNQQQIKLIDDECRRVGGSAPYAEWLSAQAEDGRLVESDPLQKLLLKLSIDMSRLQSAVYDATGKGPIKAADRQSIYEAFLSLRRSTLDMEHVVMHTDALSAKRPPFPCVSQLEIET